MSDIPEGMEAVPAQTDPEFYKKFNTSELLQYSLISPVTKNNARRTWQVCPSLNFYIGQDSLTLRTIRDDMAPIKFFWTSPNPENLLSEPPIVETAINENPKVAFVKPEYKNMLHWVDHFSEILHSKEIRLSLTSAESIFGIDEIKMLFVNYKIVGFIGTSFELLEQLLTQFLPLQTIKLDMTPDADLTADFQPLANAIRGIDEIMFGKEFPMTLENLKEVRNETITILCPSMGLRELNAWLRSWSSSESNRNLVDLQIRFPAETFARDYRRFVFHQIQFLVGQNFICNYPCSSKAWDYEPMKSLDGPFTVRRGFQDALMDFFPERLYMIVKFTVQF
ncbi:hypothetical protein GCK72_011724 [Caenorhabditis remanei]|uniref:Sdz-33 F-box domain-containing protein n=1 Tax=Caenorhabditis remanei TaxID=31234 RepID=A0A6A5H6U3_CAERE|nr:hypothetical protein GCK72_011724 [Caenorhabditis remanei]KAF1763458.1 hypothetical protein GCK72_011724 [Caenorhabditis remanei]